MSVRSRFLLPGCLLLGGCVVGQSLPMDYQADGSAEAAGHGQAVAVQVTDQRPFVLSGDKPPSFIGKYRGGFGNPWDVSTEDDVPLAQVIARALSAELIRLGFTVTERSAASLQVDISDWNFDTYQNGNFVYALDIGIADAGGEQVMPSTRVEDKVYVKGTFWSGGKGGFQRQMPEMYGDVIRRLIVDNPQTMQALGSLP